MGRSSKFISSAVRLRSCLLGAWTVASITLCTAFAGADRANAGPVTVSVPIPRVSVPKVNAPSITLPNVSVPNVSVPKVNLPTVNLSTVNATATTSPSRFDRTLKGGPWVRDIARPKDRTTGGASPLLQKPLIHSGAAAGANGNDAGAQSNGDVGGARYFAPGSQDSNTVCGRYPYPACH